MEIRRSTTRLSFAVGLALASILAFGAASASAAPAPHWQIITQAAPTYFHAGDTSDFYEVVAVNDGGAPSAGSIVLKDELPPGLVVSSVSGASGVGDAVQYGASENMRCTTSGGAAQSVECIAEEPVPIGYRVGAKIDVEVPPGASDPLRNTASIGGGGAAAEAVSTTSTPVVDPSTRVPYGASLSAETVTEEGGLATQAGAHPFSFSTILATHVLKVNPGEMCTPPGNSAVTTPGCAQLVAPTKDIDVELPPGLVGNPLNLPRCSQEDFRKQTNDGCPAATQVGAAFFAFFGGLTAEQYAPIYNLEPPPGQPAEFGFTVGGQVHVPMLFHVRSNGSYGLTVKFSNVSSFDAVRLAELSIWGEPAAPAHDQARQSFGTCEGGAGHLGCPAGVPLAPLLRMPTSCASDPLTVPLLTDSWAQPGAFALGDTEASIGPLGGCDRLAFSPALQAHPTISAAGAPNATADSPTGLHVDVHVPQNEAPGGLATPDLKDAVVKLPPGLTVNPSSANGLGSCTPAQFGLTTPVGVAPIHATDAPAECPDAAKIGTVEIDTPLLDHPLPGAVYLAQPYQNPFGSLLAIYIAVYDPVSGVVVKLAGHVEIGAEGQLTTTFDENPQLPFEDFNLDFFGGPAAPLKTPAVCGDYSTSSTLTPWSAPASGPPATPGDNYAISAAPGGGNCATSAAALPNSPAFEAGSESPLAGAFSPFVVHLSRPDGSQLFSSLTVTPPPGLLGRLAGVPYCPDAALAAAAATGGVDEKTAPSCPPASQVGTVTVGAGAGSQPYYVTGTAYLAGPYKGAPLSLAIVTPAVAGPFDLGDVVVRSALEVNPETTQITVKSDPIPTELKGIPLDIRSIAVKIDRSSFTLNPTNCEAMAAGGSLTTTVGATATLGNRFQVGGCGKLPFKPRLALRVFGKTNRNAKPRFRAVLQARPGEANIRRAQVNLPHSEFLEQNHIRTVCTRVQFAAGNGNGSACPKGSIYGRAKAWTPLLDHPLAGPVYLRSSSHKLPDLVAALNGQIDVALDGKVDSGPNKGIRNTFEVVPDAPVSKFLLELRGGGKGLLVNSEGLCTKQARSRRAIVRFVGQNGKVHAFKPRVANSCGKTRSQNHGTRKGNGKHRR